MLIDGHYGTSNTLQPSMVLDRGDGTDLGDGHYGKRSTGPAPHEGAVYVVAGSAASVSGGPLDHPAMYLGLNRFGSLVIDIDGDRLDGSFVGVTGVEDHFTLVKGEARTLFRDQTGISIQNGGRQDFRLVAGPQEAGNLYLLAGSFGTSPGIAFGGVHVPLNPDGWLQASLAAANGPVYPSSLGVLDGAGNGTAALVLPPLNDPTLVGVKMFHAYVVIGSAGNLRMASNAVVMTFRP